MSIVTRLGHRSAFLVLSLSMVFVSLAVGAAPPRGAGDGEFEALSLVEIRRLSTLLSQETAALAGTDDLLDSLHFAWFDRPYARATLAVLVKTSAALQREVRLRDRQSGAISDARVRQMLEWCDEAVTRVRSPSPSSSFRPDRLNVSRFERADSFPGSSLFGVVDRSTATAIHSQFRDFDLLAAAGMRVYGRTAREWATLDALAERAAALGIGTIAVRDGSAPGTEKSRSDKSLPAVSIGPSGGSGNLVMRPTTLRALLRSSPEYLASKPHVSVLARPALGESWPSMIARHALARGISQNGRFVTDGWTLPHGVQPTSNQPSEISAAMWVAALDGQSLGLIRGWRDLRDGSGSPYLSLFTRPAATEAMFHTALDLIRHREHVEAFHKAPSIALAIREDAVDARDDNRWATWIEPVWQALANRQIRVDVLPGRGVTRTIRSRYAAVVEIDAASVSREELLIRIERALANSAGGGERVQILGDDGTLAQDIFVRIGRTADGKPCIALANLTDRTRGLRLVGGIKTDGLRDVLMDTVVSPGALHLAPWQVMVLWPR